MPTPVGPAPRDPNDPDFWDWGDQPYSSNGGHDDTGLLAELERTRRRRRVIALVVVALVIFLIVVTTI
ncbi:MAG: hypothetical protein ACREOE_17080 [Gemmatimonadales bacterium]